MICAETCSKSECCNPDKVAGKNHAVGAQTWYDYNSGEAFKKIGDLSACVRVCDGCFHTPNIHVISPTFVNKNLKLRCVNRNSDGRTHQSNHVS